MWRLFLYHFTLNCDLCGVALDHFIGMLPVEVSASKYPNQSISTSERRFTCPICGEYVYLDKRGMFGHKNKSDENDFCERRTDSNGVYYTLPYRVGNPVYLRKISEKTYELNIGFTCLPKELLFELKKQNAIIEIFDSGNDRCKKQYSVNRLSSDSTTLLSVDFIPSLSRSYKVTVSGYSYKLDKYWSNYADGFIVNQAVFSYHSGEGRKIRKGDIIETDTDYILVTSFFVTKEGIDSELIGELKLTSWMKYNVYRIRFIPSNDRMLNDLVCYCHDSFRLTLVRQKANVIPLWPPSIQNNTNYDIIDNFRVNKVYSAIIPHNIKPMVYMHFGYDFSECNLIESLSLNWIKIGVDSPCAITISKAYSSESFGFRRKAYGESINYINSLNFKNVLNNGSKLFIAPGQRIEYLLLKGFIISCIYDNRTVDYNFNKNVIEDTNGLKHIVLSRRIDESNRVIVRKYDVIFDKNEESIKFDFVENPTVGLLVPVTKSVIDYLMKNGSSKAKYFLPQIIMSGKISFFELERINSLIVKEE